MAGEPEQGRRPRVLFVCADAVGERMAGLGIRYWELARTLSAEADVTIAHGGTEEGEREGVRTIAYRPHAPHRLRRPIASADMVVTHPQWPLVNRWLRRSRARIVVDLYCPETFETLETLASANRFVRAQLTVSTLDRLHDALRTGHRFVCASETQRDLWLGAMLALRLIDPSRYDEDPGLRQTIDLVPFGLPREAPVPGEGPRQAIAAIGPRDEVALWNGGIWGWLDAPSAIRAIADLHARRPGTHLVFMGASASHPAAAAATRQARELANAMGLLDTVVHFHEQWVPYEQRGAWLLQADCALSTHAEHLESRFAYRTRVLDCLWAGVPVVCSEGDDLAEQIEREDLGASAPPGDPKALSLALERVLDAGRHSYAQRLAAAAERRTWERVAEPLRRWIAQPAPARRPGDSPQAVGRPPGQRLREAAYLAGGRALLAGRARRR